MTFQDFINKWNLRIDFMHSIIKLCQKGLRVSKKGMTPGQSGKVDLITRDQITQILENHTLKKSKKSYENSTSMRVVLLGKGIRSGNRLYTDGLKVERQSLKSVNIVRSKKPQIYQAQIIHTHAILMSGNGYAVSAM